MLSAEAVVIRVSAGRVWIRRAAAGACAGCIQQSQCSSATLGKLLPAREFAVDCNLLLLPGDTVTVVIDDRHLLQTALLLYLLPLLVTLLVVGTVDGLITDCCNPWVLPVLALIMLLGCFWLIHRLQWLILAVLGSPPQIISKTSACRSGL